ncbi:prepilin-type N-terminal cleavage/methylation domain-containing protein [bacterium]|nr:prepilin-type N-terminal cleavage/methylation domain-containing protein [bacterium]
MKRRGFTFVELSIVLFLYGILASVLVVSFVSLLRIYHSAQIQADLKLETQRAAARIFHMAASGRCRIEADQSGLTFANGVQLRRRGSELWLGKARLLARPVRDFLALRQGQQLTLVFELNAPVRYQGPPRPCRFEYRQELQP